MEFWIPDCTSLNPQVNFHPTSWGCALALMSFKAIRLYTWFLLWLFSSSCLLRSHFKYFLHLTLIPTSVLFFRSNYPFLTMKKTKCRWQSWIQDFPVGNQLKSSSGTLKSWDSAPPLLLLSGAWGVWGWWPVWAGKNLFTWGSTWLQPWLKVLPTCREGNKFYKLSKS